jgi:hypothetical protein
VIVWTLGQPIMTFHDIREGVEADSDPPVTPLPPAYRFASNVA